MNTSIKRRVFLKGAMAAGATSAAVMAGLITPQAVIAAWNENAFKAKNLNEAINGAMGGSDATDSDAITVKAPAIAENGAVVPVTVKTSIADVTSIALLVEKNAAPLSAIFHLPEGTLPDVSTRLKMGQTSNVVAVIKADGKLYSAHKEVKVTIGGCGG